jgi:hypothetical protein
MSHKSTAPGIPYRVKPRFKRSPWAHSSQLDTVARFARKVGEARIVWASFAASRPPEWRGSARQPRAGYGAKVPAFRADPGGGIPA